MSYSQAMKHWKNHRKQRYFQPIVLGYAVGTDAANRSMRTAGRKAWDEDDYNEAVKEFNRLYPAPGEVKEDKP